MNQLEYYIITFVNVLGNILSYAILLKILLSWFTTRRNALTNLLSSITDPVLDFFRRLWPPRGMIDWSPLLAILAVDLGRVGLTQLLLYIFAKW